MMSIDSDQLITEVYARTPIWDKWSKEHSNRIVVEKLWADIAKKMNCEGTQIKKKWKYLRDQFSVELGKMKPPQSGDAADNNVSSKWKHFTQLQFLNNVVRPRPSSRNLSYVINDDASETSPPTMGEVKCETGDMEGVEDLPTDEGDCLASSSNSNAKAVMGQISQGPTLMSTLSGQQNKGKKRKKVSPAEQFNKSLLNIEQQKVQYLKEKMERKQEGEDDDLLFLKSLLPHIKTIPADQKLPFRNCVQEVVQRFAYSQHLAVNILIKSDLFTQV